MDTLAKRIQYLLKREILTQKELAKHLEIPLSEVMAIVHGEKEPELHLAVMMAEYFAVSLDWLVTGRGHIERHEEYNSTPHILRKDREVTGNVQIEINDSVKLPSGEIVNERREDFKSPFIKEILSSIRKLSPTQRKKALQILNLTFDLESN